jgi:hypothetical protein
MLKAESNFDLTFTTHPLYNPSLLARRGKKIFLKDLISLY